MSDSFSNFEMDAMIQTAQGFLDRSDIIGYAAARNVRILTEAATEYINKKNELIGKYGKPEVDDDGNETGRIGLRPDDPEFEKFNDEISRFGQLKHSPELYRLPMDEAKDAISGKELLDLWWMFEEKEGEDDDTEQDVRPEEEVQQ